MDPYTNEFGLRVIFPFTQRGFKICTSHDPHLKLFRAAERDGASFSLVDSSTDQSELTPLVRTLQITNVDHCHKCGWFCMYPA
jgi:hypothetical protein